MSTTVASATPTLVAKYMWIHKDVRKPTVIKAIQDEDIEYDRYNHHSKKTKQQMVTRP